MDSGTLAEYELVEPRVHSVETRPLEASAEVTAVATARVTLGDKGTTPIRLALVDERWRVIPYP